MKKKLITLSLLILVVIFIFILVIKNYDEFSLEAYLNHGVLLSKSTNVEEIYSYEFGEGEDFYIFNYDKSGDIKKIIKENGFKRITENNIEKITEVLNMYRDDLCEKELSLFDETTSISELVKIGSYFLYPEDLDMEDDDHYSVQIIFPKEKRVYYFAINH